jgi:hypothetical protein
MGKELKREGKCHASKCCLNEDVTAHNVMTSVSVTGDCLFCTLQAIEYLLNQLKCCFLSSFFIIIIIII